MSDLNQKGVMPKEWCRRFIEVVKTTQLIEDEELVNILNKKIQHHYTLGYQRGKRPIKQSCTWCGKTVEGDSEIHSDCLSTYIKCLKKEEE